MSFRAAVWTLLVACVCAQAQPPSPALAPAKSLSQAFAEVAKKVTPAVVNISSTRVEPGRRIVVSPLFRGLFPELGDSLVDRPREVHSLGSGVIVRANGYIVTNAHVIAGAQEILVKLADETELAAKLVGQDAVTDLAVVKVESAGLPVVAFGDSAKLEVGEWVIAVGSPLGLAQTVTAGIVSAKGRKNIGITDYEDFIQTDAAINPGNSGGALVNLDGELVGINTAIASEGGGYDGVCFATPTTVVKPVVEALIRDGRIRRPWVGVLPRAIDKDLAERLGLPAPIGVMVYNMIRNSPAHLGKLYPGDVILKWNGRELKTRSDLAELVQGTPIGATVTLEVLRQGQLYTAKVTVGERPQTLQTKGVL